MKYETAKELLLSEGYRIVAEDFNDETFEVPEETEETLDSDVFGEIEMGLGDEGFDATEVADIMTSNTEKINELIEKGVDTADIVKILAYDNCEECDDDEDCADGECCEDGECEACDTDDLDESLEDDFPETFRKPNTVQKGTDDWSDFKDDFRKKTLTLKKALTPKFVSGIIKDTDFEVDDKEIKEYAFKIIEDVFDTKNAVENLQARIRKHFVV